MILTVNGKAAAVVQDAEAYQRLLDIVADANAFEAIRQGYEDIERGRVRSWTTCVPPMKYRVELTRRAERDLRRLFQRIEADHSQQAHVWFNELEATLLSLDTNPSRGATIAEDESLRHLLFGRNRHVYRIIYLVEDRLSRVLILSIGHSAQSAFKSDGD
jgi:plasmid stabilization system protein ParE